MTTSTGTGAIAKLHLSDLLENSRVGPFQIRVFMLCMACLIMDGFDVQAMGYVGPAVLRDWNAPGPELGRVFAAANFGVLLGALLFGMLADKVGRRPVLVGATLFFSVLTIATGFARNMDELLWLRFISGIGLGCIIPNATALVGEFSPKKSRVALTMCITVGFTLGAAIGGFVALLLIPAFGWRSVFFFGGAVPFVIALAMLWGLPESLQFLAVRKQRFDQLARWLRQLDPKLLVDASTQFVANESSRAGVPIFHLFRDGRALFTILLWIVNFTNILVLYSLSNWSPTIFTSMGYTEQTSLFVGTLLQVGGTIGTLALAWVIGRRGFTSTLAVTFAISHFEHRVHRSSGTHGLAAIDHRVRCGLVHRRGAARREYVVRVVLPDLSALHRCGRGPRRRTHWRDRGSAHRRLAAGQSVDAAAAVLGRRLSRVRFNGRDAGDARSLEERSRLVGTASRRAAARALKSDASSSMRSGDGRPGPRQLRSRASIMSA